MLTSKQAERNSTGIKTAYYKSDTTKVATGKSVTFFGGTCAQSLHEFRRRANAVATRDSGSPCVAHLVGLVERSLNTNRTGPG